MLNCPPVSAAGTPTPAAPTRVCRYRTQPHPNPLLPPNPTPHSYPGPAPPLLRVYLDMYPHLKGNQKVRAAMVTALDDQVGNITQALTTTGQLHNTIIIFTSGVLPQCVP